MTNNSPINDAVTPTATTNDAQVDARESADKKASAVQDAKTPKPVTAAAPTKIDASPATEKTTDGYEKYASNDGTFVRSKLDDETNVEEGNVMENQAREPAHQQHELTFEESAPGFAQAHALMTPRGNVHYEGGGAVADVAAAKAHGES